MQAGQGFGKPSAQPASRRKGKGKRSTGDSVPHELREGRPSLFPAVVDSMQPKNEPTFLGLYSATRGLEDSVDDDDLPVGKYVTVSSPSTGLLFSLLYCGEDGEEGGPAAQLAAQLDMPAGALEAATVTVTELQAPGVPGRMMDGMNVLTTMLRVDAPAKLPCVAYALIEWHNSPNGHTYTVVHIEVPEQLRRNGFGRLLFHRLTRTMPRGAPLLPEDPERSSWGFWRSCATVKEQLAMLVERDGMAGAREFCCGTLEWDEELFDSLV